MKTSQLFYLRDDVYIEPLLHKWYVWPYLLAPATAAMNLVGRNLRLMRSFVANARLHNNAAASDKLAGGDFVACAESQVDEVRRLIEELEVEHRDYFDLRDAIIALNALLEEQQGLSLEPLYESIPAPLRGCVELTYDMNHRAGFRLIESLLYTARARRPASQSICIGLLSRVPQRPFVLSSPRLPDADHLHVEAGLGDAWLDRLAELRCIPQPLDRIAELFGSRRCSGGLPWHALLQEAVPRLHKPIDEETVRVSYLGHAGVLIESADVAILIDPVIPSRDGSNDDAMLGFSELPPHIDMVCLTHAHMDHTCIESLLQLRHRIGRVLVPKSGAGELVDPSLKLMLRHLGFDAQEMDDMEILQCPGGHIRAIPFLGEHADLRIRSKAAWLVDLHGRRVLAGADAAGLDSALYRRVAESTGSLDLLLIGMECVGAPMSWLYGSLFTRPIAKPINESRRFNGSDSEGAWRLVQSFQPGEVGLYALGTESWFRYFMGIHYEENSRQLAECERLVALCEDQGVSARRLSGKQVWSYSRQVEGVVACSRLK